MHQIISKYKVYDFEIIKIKPLKTPSLINMKAIAALALLGVASTYEDNELSVIDHIYRLKTSNPPKPVGMTFSDDEFGLLSKIFKKKKKPQPQPPQPQPPSEVIYNLDGSIAFEDGADHEFGLLSKIFKKKKKPQPQPQPQPQPPSEVIYNLDGSIAFEDGADHEFGFFKKIFGKKKKPQPQPQPQPQPPSEVIYNLDGSIAMDDADNEFIALPYWKKPYHPPPFFPEPFNPLKDRVFYDDVDTELFRQKNDELLTLENLLREAMELAEDLDKRDQLILDVMEVVRDVVPSEEVDDHILLMKTSTFVDESLEINVAAKRQALMSSRTANGESGLW